jgi:hypothetical protein
MEGIVEQVNRMGEVFVGLTVQMLLTSAALIGLVLLVEFVLRARVRAGLRYWLVTCVLAYLVLIPLLSLPPGAREIPTRRSPRRRANPTLPYPNPPPNRPGLHLQQTASGVPPRPPRRG